MNRQTAFYVAIFSTTALAVGWYFRSFRGFAAEARAREHQAEHAKSVRNRLAGVVSLIAIIFAAVLYVVALKHNPHHH